MLFSIYTVWCFFYIVLHFISNVTLSCLVVAWCYTYAKVLDHHEFTKHFQCLCFWPWFCCCVEYKWRISCQSSKINFFLWQSDDGVGELLPTCPKSFTDVEVAWDLVILTAKTWFTSHLCSVTHSVILFVTKRGNCNVSPLNYSFFPFNLLPLCDYCWKLNADCAP